MAVGHVHTVTFSPDSNLIASGHDFGMIRLWNVATKKPLKRPRIRHEDSAGRLGLGQVRGVAFDQDGKRLATAGEDNMVRLWDVKTGEPLGGPLVGHAGSVWELVFSPKGEWLAGLGENGTVWLWDVKIERPSCKQLPVQEGSVLGIAFSREGKYLVRVIVAGKRKIVRLWDTVNWGPVDERVLQELVFGEMAGKSVDLSQDGKQLATIVSRGNAQKRQFVQLWDLTRNRTLGNLDVPGFSVKIPALSFSPDGRQLAIAAESSGSKGKGWLWDVEMRMPLGRLLHGHDGGASAGVFSVAFSPDSKLIASASDDKTVCLWEITSGKAACNPLRGHKDAVNAVVFSPDGSRLASASQDGTVRLWDVATRVPLGDPLPENKDSIRFWDVAFSPDGKRLAIAVENRAEKQGEVWLWDVKNGRLMENSLQGHEYSTQAVAFSPDGKWLASAGGDKTVRLWDLEARKQLGEPLKGGGVFKDVAFSPDGRWLAAANQDAKVRLWDMDWHSRACRVANRNLTHEEWRHYLGLEESYRHTCKSIPLDITYRE